MRLYAIATIKQNALQAVKQHVALRARLQKVDCDE